MKKAFLFISILLFISIGSDVLAQGCPMCKTTIEEARKSGSQVGDTLNNGILYLLALPYLIASVFGIIWYRNYKINKKASAQL
ncbi:MAG: hypothetical protein KBE91_10845 [Bacteroidia bacterium]|nr:hypothetical protein [Bacteroidia bacterium]MBP9690100.1 hypothetical protein [Bacteroidia bacterium]